MSEIQHQEKFQERKKRKWRNLEKHPENQRVNLERRNSRRFLAMQTREILFWGDYVNKKDEFNGLSDENKLNLKNIIWMKSLSFWPRSYNK